LSNRRPRSSAIGWSWTLAAIPNPKSKIQNPVVVAAFLALFFPGRGPFAGAWAHPQEAPAPNGAAVVESQPAAGAVEYMGRRIAPTMHYSGAAWLLRESREREEDCATMLKQLHLRPGMTVADMGCGNGFYTLRLATLLEDTGRVLAVDIQPEMLRLLEERAREAKVDNIELIQGSVDNARLPPGQVDLILCVDVYHEFSHPEQMLETMRKSLRPSGRLVLVEFRAEDPEVPIKPLHKMSRQQILKELTANGFRLVRQFDGLPWQHMMFFSPIRGHAESAAPNNL
jgi:SAM-dependent methyltransferase